MGSRGSPGMSRNVQRALGIITERQTTESAKCGTCSQYFHFPTDAIGRTLQSCRCGTKLLSSGNAQANDKLVQKALEAAAIEERDPRGIQRKKSFAARNCELTSCAKSFMPNVGNQRFCSRSCGMTHRWQEDPEHVPPNRTLGKAGRTNPNRSNGK